MPRLSLRRLFAAYCLPLAGLGWASLAGSAAAQPVTGPYVSLGGGANFLPDEKTDAAGLYGAGRLRLKTGATALGSVGYGFGNGFRVELEGDWRRNDVRDYVTSQAPYDVRAPFTGSGRQRAVGGMVNVLYDLDIGSPYIYPYFGVGAGYQRVSLDDVTLSQAGTGSLLQADGTKSGLGYQGIAGLAFPVPWVVGLSVTAEYRLLGTAGRSSGMAYEAAGTPPLGEVGLPIAGTTRLTRQVGREQSALIGLRYELFQPPAPPAPDGLAPATAISPPPPPAPQAARTYLVFFDWDRADLSGRARQIVAEAAQASTHVATTRIEVNGYTDLSGTAVYNQALSVRRARAVQAELVSDGVAPGEITLRGHGESDPLVPTAAGVREPQNRRVEIILQ